MGRDLEDHLVVFEQVDQKGLVISKYAMPYENNLPVYIGRKPKVSIEEFWPELKHYN